MDIEWPTCPYKIYGKNSDIVTFRSLRISNPVWLDMLWNCQIKSAQSSFPFIYISIFANLTQKFLAPLFGPNIFSIFTFTCLSPWEKGGWKFNWKKEWTYLFVDLKSNSALLYNKGHNFWKSLLTRKIPLNWIVPY